MNKIISVLAIVLLVAQASYAQSDSRTSKIDAFLEKSVEEGIIPGGVFQVSHKDQLVYDKTIGYADLEKTRPYKVDDIFRIASMTKALTCVSIMQLYEEGELLIDDPVSLYIPAFADTKVLDQFNEVDSSYTVKDLDRPITLRHLLTHTSGIYYGQASQGKHRAVSMKNNAMEYGLSHTSASTQEMAEHIATIPLAHQPGEQWTYGLSMDILGRVVEVVSGLTLEKYFEANILNPLQMNDTHFYLPKEKESRLVPVYMQLNDGTYMNPDPNLQYPIIGFKNHFAGGGGLSSTASDYMKFVEALVKGGSVNGVRILGRKTIDYMKANQVEYLAPVPSKVERSKGWGFGLGFQVYTEASIGSVAMSPGTYAWGGYFNTKFWIDPAEQLTFVGMTQVVPFRHDKFWDKLYALIYSAID